MKWSSKTCIIGFIVLLAASSVRAAPITIEIEGVVDSVIDANGYNFGGTIQSGSIITGYYTYNSDTPDSTPESLVKGTYLNSGEDYGMWLNVENYSFDAFPKPATLEISILNNAPRYEYDPQPDDFYEVLYNSNNFPIYENGDVTCRMNLQLGNYDGTAINSKNLPIVSPNITSWPNANYLTVFGGIYDSYSGRLINGYEIYGHITSAILVPEPCISPLLLGGIVLLRKRKER